MKILISVSTCLDNVSVFKVLLRRRNLTDKSQDPIGKLRYIEGLFHESFCRLTKTGLMMNMTNLLSCFEVTGLVLLSVGVRRGDWLVCWSGSRRECGMVPPPSLGLARGPRSHRSPLPSLSFNSRYCSSTRPCLFLPKQALLCSPHPIGTAWEFICLAKKKKKKKGTTHPSVPACIEPPNLCIYCKEANMHTFS